MTNYRETSAYDLSLFEPQVVETKRVRETEPVRKQQVKRTPAKKTSSKKTVKKQSRPQSVSYTRTTNNTVRRAVERSAIIPSVPIFSGGNTVTS